MTASAQPFAQPGPQLTVVLVHGAFGDPSSWNGVIQRLQQQGCTVLAPATPLRGLGVDSAYLASVVDQLDGPVLLVGLDVGLVYVAPSPPMKANAWERSRAPPPKASSTRPWSRQGGSMDFSARLDELQQRVAQTKEAAEAAASESREQLRQRIDQAQVDVDLAVKDAQQQVGEAAAGARGKWAQLKADAAARMDDLQAKMDRRADQLDAKLAASEADGAEADAADAIDFAAWTVDNARLAVLDAIDARAYADELARTASS